MSSDEQDVDIESDEDEAPPARWVAALEGAARAGAPHACPPGLRRCGVCGAVVATALRMQGHVEGRRHCEAVARRAIAAGAGDAPDAAAAAAAFDEHSTKALADCVPEPPDVALAALQAR